MTTTVTMGGISLERPRAASKRVGRGRSTLHHDVRSGTMTPPIKIGLRWSAWPSDELDAIQRARIAGWTDAQLRELVKALMVRRQTAAPMRIVGVDEPAAKSARRGVAKKGTRPPQVGA